jgi:hypothetical protein
MTHICVEIGSKYGLFYIAVLPIWRGGSFSFVARCTEVNPCEFEAENGSREGTKRWDKEARTVVHALSGVEKRRVEGYSEDKVKSTKARR